MSRRRPASSGRDVDVAVIGAGHNGLVSAAYLAKAGYRVAVFERRHIVGGAVATEELVPGFQFDIGGSAHILIRLTPVVEELELSRYGLEYLELDPLFFSPSEDGAGVYFYRDADRTAQELEEMSPGQGVGYRRFLDDWTPFAQMVLELFSTVPGPFQMGRKLVRRRPGADMRKALATITQPYGAVLDRYLIDERIIAPMVWMAAQSGPPPTEALTAPFLLWHPLYHQGGVARPRGGSGQLTRALADCIRAHGGEVHLNAPVQGVVVENGRAVGLELEEGGVSARCVLSACHALETLGRLLPEDHRPEALGRMRTGNGFGAILRLALDRPVDYPGHDPLASRTGLQLLCRNRDQISAAYGEYLRGRPASDPPLVAMTFSAVDDSLAPPGQEVLWLWGQYFPRTLAGSTWSELRDSVAQTLLSQFERYAPGTAEHVVGELFQDPEWLEANLGLVSGNVMHLEMSLDQMFCGRPAPGLAGYRSHLPSLYLTGASTHPGGGIMGASGRNAARVVLDDLERRRT